MLIHKTKTITNLFMKKTKAIDLNVMPNISQTWTLDIYK